MNDRSSRTLVHVNPFRCRMWDFHDRLESYVTENSCRAEIESFRRHGQLVPVLGRRLQSDPAHDVELIYGARRLFIAQHLNLELLVELRDLNDKRALVAMDVENRHRLDVSPYERAHHYIRCLRTGLFSSQDELARELEVSASQVSRLLKLARLPSAVVSAFDSPVDICETWGIELADALETPERRARIMQRARGIGNLARRPSPSQIYEQLISAGMLGRITRTRARDEVVHGRAGLPLFRIRQHRNALAIILPTRSLSSQSINQIRDALAAALDSEPVSREPSPRVSQSQIQAGTV